MKKQSAGILLYKYENQYLQVLLVHPGGPFWKKKDNNAWTIPKGELGVEESPLETAMREFEEETGVQIQRKDDLIQLEPIKQNSGKIVHAWALEQDLDVESIKSNLFELEWPPKSGRIQQFPEIDKGEWFYIPTAKTKILEKQFALIEDLIRKIGAKDSQIGLPDGYIAPKGSQLSLFD